MYARSTALTETEAIEWAARGLVRLKDVTSGARIQSHISFRQQFGTSLDHTLILAVREGVPEAWQVALRDGSALTRQDTHRITQLLTREGGDAQGPREQQYAMQRPSTLVTRPSIPVARLRVRHVYDAMTAAVFALPRVFDPSRGGAARHAHLFASEPADKRAATIGKAIGHVRHPAVPAEMQETAYCVALSGFAFGPEKRTISGRADCPCGKGHEETVEHTFQRCERSRRLWQLVLEPWRRVTTHRRDSAGAERRSSRALWRSEWHMAVRGGAGRLRGARRAFQRDTQSGATRDTRGTQPRCSA